MTTSVQFLPSNTAPFQFQAVLDGEEYTVSVPWNVQSAVYYVKITGANGDIIVYRSLIASPPNFNISMTAGYFSSSLVFLDQQSTFVVSP